jgi:hypothetical protein
MLEPTTMYDRQASRLARSFTPPHFARWLNKDAPKPNRPGEQTDRESG